MTDEPMGTDENNRAPNGYFTDFETTLPREEAVKLAMAVYGWTRSYAEFYIALANDEIKSDVVGG